MKPGEKSSANPRCFTYRWVVRTYILLYLLFQIYTWRCTDMIQDMLRRCGEGANRAPARGGQDSGIRRAKQAFATLLGLHKESFLRLNLAPLKRKLLCWPPQPLLITSSNFASRSCCERYH